MSDIIKVLIPRELNKYGCDIKSIERPFSVFTKKQTGKSSVVRIILQPTTPTSASSKRKKQETLCFMLTTNESLKKVKQKDRHWFSL